MLTQVVQLSVRLICRQLESLGAELLFLCVASGFLKPVCSISALFSLLVPAFNSERVVATSNNSSSALFVCFFCFTLLYC